MVSKSKCIESHVGNNCNMQRSKTPFPAPDGTAMGSMWERAQEVCHSILSLWAAAGWYLGANLWQGVRALVNEAKAHRKRKEKQEGDERKSSHAEWAEHVVGEEQE